MLQIQGRGGERQVPRHEVGIVTSGALMDASAASPQAPVLPAGDEEVERVLDLLSQLGPAAPR